jgi:double-stranded uracil-DNA glycosylase
VAIDPTTIDVYERAAGTYAANRPPRFTERAADLAASAADRPVLDAGCGTGAYLDSLGSQVVGLDASPAMLGLAASQGQPLVRADLSRLPFRPRSLGAAWARNSYLHVPHADLPLALAELHRALPVGARVSCSLITGPDDEVVTDDDLPGRRFWRWSDAALIDVFTGAGFTDVSLDGAQPRFVDAVRARTLPDTVGPGMRLLVCGLNPSLHAADAGVGFVTPSNRFWRAAIEAGLVTRVRDPWHAVREHGVGMTDLVKRATRRADELSADEYAAGLDRVDRLCTRLQPGAVVSVGLAGWRAAVDRRAEVGVQDRTLGGRPVYVMPSTSGLNASSRYEDLVAHLRAAFDLAGSTS